MDGIKTKDLNPVQLNIPTPTSAATLKECVTLWDFLAQTKAANSVK
jgi:hypothetical protein